MTDKPDWQDLANDLRGTLSNIETEFDYYCRHLDHIYELKNAIIDNEKRSEFGGKWKNAERLSEEIDTALRESYRLIDFIEDKLV